MRKSHGFVQFVIIIVFISCSKITGPGDLLIEPQPGADYEYTISGVTFHMKYVPPKSFYIHRNDSEIRSVEDAYLIGETEVTYELWDIVYQWAINNGYTFAYGGVMGDNVGDTIYHPVSHLIWRDALIWTNALTEYYNLNNGSSPDLDCVYYSDSDYMNPIRVSTGVEVVDYPNPGSIDDPYIKEDAKGFRLPTWYEWELAARYIEDTNNDGNLFDAGEYYPGNHVSGADAPYDQTATVDMDGDGIIESTGDVAVYHDNSGSTCAPVKSKRPNALGLYDMSGNMYEFVFDWFPEFVGQCRIRRGATYGALAENQQVGWLESGPTPYEHVAPVTTLRVVRSF